MDSFEQYDSDYLNLGLPSCVLVPLITVASRREFGCDEKNFQNGLQIVFQTFSSST